MFHSQSVLTVFAKDTAEVAAAHAVVDVVAATEADVVVAVAEGDAIDVALAAGVGAVM